MEKLNAEQMDTISGGDSADTIQKKIDAGVYQKGYKYQFFNPGTMQPEWHTYDDLEKYSKMEQSPIEGYSALSKKKL